MAGDNVFFNCSSDHDPSWHFRAGSLPMNAGPVPGRKTLLFIVNVNSKNVGEYTCVGTQNKATFYAMAGLLIVSKFKH